MATAIIGLATIGTLVFWFVNERLFPKKADRGPSSVIYNDDDELVMEEVGLEDLAEKKTARGNRWDAVFSAAPGKKLITHPVELSHLTGSANGVRARAVVFQAAAFNRFVNTATRKVPLDLFDDVRVEVRFGPPPSYGPNTGVFSGAIDSDASARVHFFVSGNSIGGTIETSSRLYRILDGGKPGLHYIVEERRPNR